MIGYGRTIIFIYYYVYVDEVRVSLTAQINTMKTTLKHVGLSDARVEDYC